MILLTGATGTVGSAVATALAAVDEPVRLMVRRDGDAPPGAAETVVGDFGDRASLDRALDGVEKAFLLTPQAAQQAEWEIAFIDAAAHAGVSLLVKHSAVGADPEAQGVARPHGIAEQHLAASGMEHVIVRPVMFMDNLLRWVPSIPAAGAVVAPLVDPSVKLSLVDVADIAAVEAAALTEAHHAGRTYTVTGPELLTFEGIAARLSEGTGAELALEVLDPEAFRQRSRAAGAPEAAVEGQIGFFSSLTGSTTALTVLTDDVADVLGRPASSLADFAARHTAAFTA
jgi:uncharacterized protein YbjT (DUF2867 family)